MGVVAVLVMIFICGGTLSADYPPLPKGCRINGKMYQKGYHFISRHGASGTCSNCVCQGQDRVGCLLMCTESLCQYGHDGFRKVERARGCYCKVPRCLPKPTLPVLHTGCHHEGKIYHKGQPFISRAGSSGNSCGSCVCKGYGRVSCVPLCPLSICPFGNAGFRKIQHASGCYCKIPRCVLPTMPPLKTIKLKAICVHKKRLYLEGNRIKIDCNTCVCTRKGFACTKMACIIAKPPIKYY